MDLLLNIIEPKILDFDGFSTSPFPSASLAEWYMTSVMFLFLNSCVNKFWCAISVVLAKYLGLMGKDMSNCWCGITQGLECQVLILT